MNEVPQDEALEAFIAEQPPEFASVIRRHGQEVYAFSFRNLAISGAFSSLAQAAQNAYATMSSAASKREIAEDFARSVSAALASLTHHVEEILQELSDAQGHDPAKVQECMQDLTRAAEIASRTLVH